MKSIFTKLSTLLLCGAVALVGCTDYSEDIQAVDKNVNDLKTEFEGYKTSTAATIAELQSAINALEAAQEQMAADYAKKSELETAVTTLQSLVNEKAEALQAALTDAAGKIAALEAGKADKAVVEQLQKDVTKAIEDANATIAALDAAKADKAELELVKADVATLIQGYTQTVELLQNISNTLTTVQSDLDLVEEDVESLKTASAEAVYAITNLQAALDAISTRVSVLETELASAKQEISQHTEALTNILGRLEAVEGNLEDEAAARAEADKLLNDAVLLLDRQFRNLEIDFKTYVEEMETYKANLAKEIDDLKAQDSALAKSILSYYEQSIAAVDSAVKDLRDEIAALKAEIIAAWELEKAALHNMIDDIQKTLEAWCQENTDAIDELRAQDAALAKIIIDNYELLVALIDKGDADLKTYTDEQIVLLYNTVMDWLKTLNIVIEENNAALLEKITNNYTDLSNKIVAASDELAYQIKVLRSNLDYDIAVLNQSVDAILKRVQSIVLVPDYNDGKATIHFATIQGYPIIGPSTLKYRVQAINEEETATITESIATAWKANPQALTYDVIPVKERTRSAEDATLVIENVVADGDFLNVTVRPSAFDGAFYTSKLGRNVDSDYTRTTSYSASLIFTDGVNNVTSEYYNLYPEVTEIGMKIVIPGEKEELVDITNVLPGEKRQKLAYTDVETKKTLLAGHEVLFSVNGEDYTYAALLEKLGYDMTLRLSAEASYSGYEDDVDTYNLPYGGYPGLTFVYGDFTIEPSKDFTVKLNKPLAKEQVGEVLTVEYTYFINDEVSVKTSSEVEMTYEIVNVTIDPVTVEWSYALADQLRGTNSAGEDVPYIKTYIAEGVTHDCPYNLGTILKAISRENKLEKTVKVNGEKLTGDRVRFSNYVDADKAFDIEFLKGSPKFSAEGPTEYEIVYHGIYNNQYDVTATAVVVFEQIPTYEVTSNVVLASVSGTNYFGADDALLKDALLNSAINADLGYENVSAAIQGVYNSLTDAVSTKTEVKYGAKSTDLTAGNGNVQLNLSAENVDLSKVYLFNNQIVDLLGKNILEDEAVFTIEHTVTSWNGVVLKYVINATTDLPDFTLATDPMYVENDIVEVRGELTGDPKVYTVDVADLARYFYVYNEGAESLVAPSANAPVLDVTFSLKGQKDATGFSIKDNNYVNPVDYAKKGQLELGKAVVNWGTYPYTEIVVNAVLNANGYPIASKDITLVTIDPLKILFKDVDVAVSHQAGTNAKPVIAKAYTNFTMTSVVEPTIENLCDVEASNVAGLFTTSKADTTYGLKVELELVDNPYYELNGVKKYWDADKYVVGYDADGNFDGTIYIGADDAGIKMPLKAKVGVKVTHKIHAASEECVNEGVITITFNPAK